MAKGYVYIMTTAVDGIIKIGRSDNWTRRCQEQLEANGYKNMNGLKTYFVAKVDNQEEIESIMHDIFRESRVSNFEMFAVDKDRAKRVLSKMGEQVYPEIVKTTANNTKTEQLYIDAWTRINKIIESKNKNINLNNTLNRNCYNISIPVKGFWLHAWFSIKNNQFNIDFGTGNIKSYGKEISNYKNILDKNLPFNIVYEDSTNHPSFERLIHYKNNIDITKLSDNDINHFVDLIIKFYDAIISNL